MHYIQKKYVTLAATLIITDEEKEKIYNEIWVEPLGQLMEYVIFANLSNELDKNHTTL